MIKQRSEYLVTADTLAEAIQRYKGKRFVMQNSPTHTVVVEVTRVELRGGYVIPYAKLVRTIKAAKLNKTIWRGAEQVWPGKLSHRIG